MADQIILSSNGYQSSSDDETLLSLVNSASLDLIGVPAQVDIRPTKSELISTLNDIHKKFCNPKDWRFLREVGTVAGYNVLTDTDNFEVSGSTSLDQTIFTATPSTTDYVATKVTFNTPVFPSTVRALVGQAATGFAVVLDASVLICPDVGGAPDVDNAITTSEVISFDGQNIIAPTSSGKGGAVTFNFANTTDIGSVVVDGLAYWLVLKLEYAENNGSAVNTLITNGSNVGAYKRAGDAAWITHTSPIWFDFTYYEAEWLSEITLSMQVQKVYRLYAGSISNPSCILLPWQDDKFANRPLDMPMDSFTQRPYAVTGAINIYIKPNATKVPVWYVEYKRKAVTLVNDNDVPLIPSGYRVLLKDKLVLHYMNLGMGTQDSGGAESIAADIALQELAMRREYLPKPAGSFSVSIGGTTPHELVDEYQVPNSMYRDLGVYNYIGAIIPSIGGR